MSDVDYALNDDERRWIASLRRLAAKRPSTLGLWGGTGPLQVVALTEDGALTWPDEVVCNVTSIDIPAGGGDPDWVQVEDVERPWAHVAAPGDHKTPAEGQERTCPLGESPEDCCESPIGCSVLAEEAAARGQNRAPEVEG